MEGMNPRTQTTDHERMLAVARGDLESMSGIYQNRHRSLFRFFFRLSGRQATAEDLVHEVFLRMIRYRHTYRSGDSFEAWMYRIARNAFADQAKKYRLESPVEEGQFEVIDGGGPSPYESLAKQQDLALLHRA